MVLIRFLYNVIQFYRLKNGRDFHKRPNNLFDIATSRIQSIVISKKKVRGSIQKRLENWSTGNIKAAAPVQTYTQDTNSSICRLRRSPQSPGFQPKTLTMASRREYAMDDDTSGGISYLYCCLLLWLLWMLCLNRLPNDERADAMHSTS